MLYIPTCPVSTTSAISPHSQRDLFKTQSSYASLASLSISHQALTNARTNLALPPSIRHHSHAYPQDKVLHRRSNDEVILQVQPWQASPLRHVRLPDLHKREPLSV